MDKKIIKARFKQRIDTFANWESANPVLLRGEVGWVSDNPGFYKLGDGATAWKDLPILGFSGKIVQELGNDPNALISQAATTAEILKAKQEAKGKQDAIEDLDEIRQGASKGATALQAVPSEYAKKTDLAGKVDKVAGKQLTTEDFTTTLKQKLESLNNYDDAQIQKAVSDLRKEFDTLLSGNPTKAIESFNEIIAFLNGVEDSENLDSIIASIEQQIASVSNTLASKVDKEAGKGLSTYDFNDSRIEQIERASNEPIRINWEELKDLRDNNKLIPGRLYRITDYVTTTSQENTQSAGHRFDIIVLALDNHTLAEEAWAIYSEEDSYFADHGANLSAWKICYCLDNNRERFAWADEENGKGVIYRMIDEWGNDCPYDFKNIQFKRGIYADGEGIAKEEGDGDYEVFCYTFSWEDEEHLVIMDASIFGNNGRLLNDEGQISGVYGNTIKSYINYTGEFETPSVAQQLLNNIVFLSTFGYEEGVFYGYYGNSFGNNCHHNSFGNFCFSNSFGNDCYGNSFGNDCYLNSFGNDCSSNSFGNSCYDNSFGNECSGNSFGTNCYDNSFGIMCKYNSFGNECDNNSFGDSGNDNSFGNNCSSNSFGNSCYDNSFGNECNNNSFGNLCYGNRFGYSCSTNLLESHCVGNNMRTNCQGITMGLGCSGNTIDADIDGGAIFLAQTCNFTLTENGKIVGMRDGEAVSFTLGDILG